jgi:hypothetical protein
MIYAWGLDCMGANVGRVADAKPGAIWPYVTGSADIAWTTEQIQPYRDRGCKVYRVNQGYQQTPDNALDGDEFDLEAGAWDIPALVEVVRRRRLQAWPTRIYSSWSKYGLMKQALAENGIGQSIWFRIADWNLSAHLADLALHGDVYASQWASPTSNPHTFVPGTSLKLADAQCDLNVVLQIPTGWDG